MSQIPGFDTTPQQAQESAKGFVTSLFDFSFRSFITPKIVKAVFLLLILIAVLFTLTIIVGGFTQHWMAGVFFLVVSPIIFLVYVVFARIYLEVIIVLFRIYEELRDANVKR